MKTKEQILERHRKYYWDNRDARLEYRRINKDRINAQKREYRKTHPRILTEEQRLENNKKAMIRYYKEPFHYKNLVKNAMVWNRTLSFTKEELQQWYSTQEQECIYCHTTPNEMTKSDFPIYKKYKRLTLDRLDNNHGYSLDNIGLACMVCNRTKSNIFTYKQMIEIGKLVSKFLK